VVRDNRRWGGMVDCGGIIGDGEGWSVVRDNRRWGGMVGEY
jgi:hypothetical protein